MIEFITKTVTDVKTAIVTAFGTIASGFVSLGDFATLFGSILSIVLIVVHIRQHTIKMKIMKLKLKKEELECNLKD